MKEFMKIKIPFRQSGLIISIVGILFSAVIILFAVSVENPQMSFAAQSQVMPVSTSNFGTPIRIAIPKINISAPIISLGLTKSGAMDAPKGPKEVGWFNLGPRPGESGSSVMAGHFGWKNSIPAVFDNLSKLKKGDKVFVFDEKGVKSTFVVKEIRTYGERDDTSLIFGSNDGNSHLNLITCKGTWNKYSKSYSNRLVVFTDKE